MSLRELYDEFDAALQRKQDEADARMVLAWNMVVLGRHKRLPALASLLTQTQKGKAAQTTEQMRQMLYLLSGMYGGPVGPMH